MLPVVIRVENLENKSSFERIFRSSAVRIGRNQLNELTLPEPFVSLWHGIIRFDEDSTEYMDLNSTNGSDINGERAKGNVFVPVDEKTDLRIGSLRLHISRSAVAITAEPDARDLTLFHRAAGGGVSGDPDVTASQPIQPTLHFKVPIRSFALPSAERPSEASPAKLVSSLFLLYENYRRSWRTLSSQLTHKLSGLPEAEQAAALQLLQQRMPELVHEGQFQALAAAAGLTPTIDAIAAQPLLSPAIAMKTAPTPSAKGTPDQESLTLTGVQLEAIAKQELETPGAPRARPTFEALRPDQPRTNGSSNSNVVTLFSTLADDKTLIPTGLESTLPKFQALAQTSQPAPSKALDFLDESLPSRTVAPSRKPSSTPVGFQPDQDSETMKLVRRFARTYAPELVSLDSQEDVERFLGQVSAVLEEFSKAFLELRRGHDQFGKEVAVSTASDSSPLRHAKTPGQVLRFLLGADAGSTERLQTLTRGFADVAIQQVAFVAGVRRGIRALLEELSPTHLESNAAWAKPTSLSMRSGMWPIRALRLWRHYEQRHAELLQEGRVFQAVVFGEKFARGFAEVLDANVAKLPPLSEKVEPAMPHPGARRSV